MTLYPKYDIFTEGQTSFVLSYIINGSISFIERYENGEKYGSLMVKENLIFPDFSSIKNFYFHKKKVDQSFTPGKYPSVSYRTLIDIID